jgi:hypothetical protein
VSKLRSTDWQLDLKPVTLSQTPAASPPRGETIAAPRGAHATNNDAAILNTLSAVTAAVTELSRAVEAMGRRLDGLEQASVAQTASSQSLANQLMTNAAVPPPPAATPPAAAPAVTPGRSARSTTRALRDSTTAPLERRSRRSPAAKAAPAAKPDADAPAAE